ncbi:bacteriophage antitermination protein Q [Limnobaculum xujianqingii]|uniref:bacteriophage antitermination protein Q n=1 Tax=Limnobaculum xujianqingii TaxID=2738837 RepID=UPI00112A33C3|nr:bacteriophage antitermination protein Q [Limnobaculum xujianqingii]
MNLEWLRGNVITALSDFHATNNGQLGAMEGQIMLRTDRFNKNVVRYIEIGAGKKVRVPHCVLNVKQTRNGGRSKPLIEEITYNFSGWRRSIHQLADEQKAWILYCYGDFKYRNEQFTVVPYIWEKFTEQYEGKRITGKVKSRLQALAWLAVQVAAGEIKGYKHLTYTDTELAAKLGVSKQSLYKDYKDYWHALLSQCFSLDKAALSSSRPARRLNAV